MSLAVSIVPQGFKEAEHALAGIKNEFPNAAAKAINRGLIAGRKVASKAVQAQYKIKAADFKQNLVLQKASKGHLVGLLDASGAMLPISLFPHSVRRAGKSRRQFIRVAIKKGKSKLIKGAFVIPGGQIMERRQPTRIPIFPVFTIGVAQMVGSRQVSDDIRKEMDKATASTLAHEVKFRLARAAAS
jgi:minor tail protein Z (GPZ)